MMGASKFLKRQQGTVLLTCLFAILAVVVLALQGGGGCGPGSCQAVCADAHTQAVQECKGDQACIDAANAAFDTCLNGCSQQ